MQISRFLYCIDEEYLDKFTKDLIAKVRAHDQEERDAGSAVYWALNLKDFNNTRIKLKIGETEKVRQRNSQLGDYHIMGFVEVANDKTIRLFIEAYLRSKLAAFEDTQSFRTDYFDCPYDIYRLIAHQFETWVQEAKNILTTIITPPIQSYSLSEMQGFMIEQEKFINRESPILSEIFSYGSTTRTERLKYCYVERYVENYHRYLPDIKITTEPRGAWTRFTYVKNE